MSITREPQYGQEVNLAHFMRTLKIRLSHARGVNWSKITSRPVTRFTYDVWMRPTTRNYQQPLVSRDYWVNHLTLDLVLYNKFSIF